MAEQHIYKIMFFSQGQVYEIYARQVSQGGLFGFIEVEEIVFGQRTQVVVDPSEEALKREFEGVKRTFMPMHAILRIDEVDREGPARIRSSTAETGAVTPFPMQIYPPGGGGSKKS